MATEHSFGIVAFHAGDVLIVQHSAGHWGFPKGHARKGETPLAAAAREFEEETGVTVYEILDLPPLVEEYTLRRKKKIVRKDVTYFLARVDEPACRIQEEELLDLAWVTPDIARSRLTFEESRRILAQALAAWPR